MSLAAIRMKSRSKSYGRSKESGSKAAVSSALPQQVCGSKVNVRPVNHPWTASEETFGCNVTSAICEHPTGDSRKRTFQRTCGPVQLKRNVLEEKAGDVAKIIEFYIPKSFRKKGKWIYSAPHGKVIEFLLRREKSA